MGQQIRLAYLVLAYREPELLGQLTRWLSAGSEDIFVHVDLNVDPQPFISAAHPSANFLDTRFSCPWGTWGRVGASLAMLEAAVTAGASHLLLLSEDSFPCTILVRFRSSSRRTRPTFGLMLNRWEAAANRSQDCQENPFSEEIHATKVWESGFSRGFPSHTR